MKLTRRHLLTSSATLGVSALVLNQLGYSPFKSKSFSPKGLILGGGQGLSDNQKIFFLCAVSLNHPKPIISRIPMSFLGHGLSFHPLKPHLASVFEKKGPGACELNLKTGETRLIETDPSRYFYGHGVYLPQSQKLLSTETVLKTGEGLIVIRDAESLKIEGQFPSYGANPHDCTLIDNGSILAITNGGAPIGQSPRPSVTYVDVKSENLLETFEIEDQNLNAGHLAISKHMDLAVVSAPRLGLPESNNGSISLLSKDKKLVTLKEPKDIINKLKSETLSVCIDDDRGILATTSPAGNLVTFWEIPTGKFIKAFDLPSPRGIILSKDKTHFLFSYDKDASLGFISADTLTLDSSLEVNMAGFSGSHLYQI